MVSKLALGAIWGYQRYISPYKGFRCAHAVLHGGHGCSGYAKRAIRHFGLWDAIPAIRQRLSDCRVASETLRANCAVHANWAEEQANSPRRGRKRRRRKSGDGWFGSACDCGEFAFCGLALPAACIAAPADAQPTPDKLGVPADGATGADGCGGLDCSVPSCDGCGGCDCSPSCG